MLQFYLHHLRLQCLLEILNYGSEFASVVNLCFILTSILEDNTEGLTSSIKLNKFDLLNDCLNLPVLFVK